MASLGTEPREGKVARKLANAARIASLPTARATLPGGERTEVPEQPYFVAAIHAFTRSSRTDSVTAPAPSTVA